MTTDLKPRLELRIGITGHRPHRLSQTAIAAIRSQLFTVLSTLSEELDKCLAEAKADFSDQPARLVLVSPLAAGADQMAAEVALEIGAKLDVCLPFPAARYREDFVDGQVESFDALLARADRVVTLPGDEMHANEAYRAVGTFTLAQSDLLIAVWDGKPAAGLGGTPDVIAEAVADHRPVLVIDANGKLPPRVMWSGTEAEPHDTPTIETVAMAELEGLFDQLVRLLTLPPSVEIREYERFLEARADPASRPIGYPLLQAITGARSWKASFRISSEEDSAAQIRPMLDVFAPTDACTAHVQTIVLPRFVAADMTANLYALMYRGGFVANFVMSALAVMLALAGLLAPSFKIGFILAELVVITVIVLRTRQASRGGWHRRWIDSRHLAELLRILTLSSALGNLSLRKRGDMADPAGWPGWYARATARELGMPPVHLSGEHVARVRDTALDLIGDQRAYHNANAHRMERIDHWLRHVGESLFVVTILACLGWLITKFSVGAHVELLGMDATALVTFASALLPAVGAAMYGIRMQGDFAAAAERSNAISRQLERLKLAIERDPLDHERLASRLRRLSEIMLSEIDQWRQMSEVRPLELPG